MLAQTLSFMKKACEYALAVGIPSDVSYDGMSYGFVWGFFSDFF